MISINNANKLFQSGNYVAAIEQYREIIIHNPELEKALQANIVLAEKRRDKKITKTINEQDVKLISKILEQQPKKIPVNYQIYLNAVEDIKFEIYTTKTLLYALHCLEASPFQISILKFIYEIIKKLDLQELLIPYQTTPSLTLGSLIKLATDQDYWAAYRNILKNQLIKHNFCCLNSTKLFSNDPLGVNYKINRKSIITIQNKEISFGTILLNEQKYIGANLSNHYNLCDEWIIVEGACKGYPERKVSKSGVSLDSTEKIINLFPDPDGKITYIQHGWTNAAGEAAKSELRNEYLTRSTGLYLVVIDADEFYEKEDLEKGINDLRNDQRKFAIVFPQIHFWKTTENFITGEYYDISHTRFFRNVPGMKYIRNHNFPELNGKYIHEHGQFKYQRNIVELQSKEGSYIYEGPKCYHMGFAKDTEDMQDKTQYYINRGENITRISTTVSRAGWFNGDLPEKCVVRKWGGAVPILLKSVENIK